MRHGQQSTQPRFTCEGCRRQSCEKCIDKARLKLIKHGHIEEESKRICQCTRSGHITAIAEG